MYGDYSLRMLPKWISPASFPHLNSLILNVVHSVEPEDIKILGTLSNLSFLSLMADCWNIIERPLQKFLVSADAFPRVTACSFTYVVTVASMFTRGALKLQY